MTLKTRRLLFYSSLLFFILAAALVIFYSMGFRFDFANKLITETGGIYVKSDPIEAEIVLSGEAVKNESGILNTGTLIDNLSSGNYNIVVSASGHSTWEKNADVTPGTVTIFESIVLVSDLREKIHDSVDSFKFSEDLLVTESRGVIEFGNATITEGAITHLTNNGHIITSDDEEGEYYLYNLTEPEIPVNLTATFNFLKETELLLPGYVEIVKIEPYPSDETRFVIMTGRAIYTLDIEGSEIDLIGSSTKDFIIAGNDVLWASDVGIFSYDLVLEEETRLYDLENGFPKQWAFDSSDDKIIILDKSNTLFAYDIQTATTTIVSPNASYFSMSPSGRFILFNDNAGVANVYDSRLEEGGRRKQFIKLIPLGQAPYELSWYEGETHVFVKDGGSNLTFVEIDDFTPVNSVRISGNVRAFTYDQANQSLYYGNDEGIWRLEI